MALVGLVLLEESPEQRLDVEVIAEIFLNQVEDHYPIMEVIIALTANLQLTEVPLQQCVQRVGARTSLSAFSRSAVIVASNCARRFASDWCWSRIVTAMPMMRTTGRKRPFKTRDSWDWVKIASKSSAASASARVGDCGTVQTETWLTTRTECRARIATRRIAPSAAWLNGWPWRGWIPSSLFPEQEMPLWLRRKMLRLDLVEHNA